MAKTLIVSVITALLMIGFGVFWIYGVVRRCRR